MLNGPKLIWIIVGSLKGGGTQSVAVRTFEDYKRLGYSVQMVVMREKGKSSLQDVHFLSSSRALGAMLDFYCLWLKFKPSHIISFNLELSIVALPLRIFSTVVVTRVMNTLSKRVNDSRLGSKDRLLTRIYIFLLPLFNKIIVQCDCMLKDLILTNRYIDVKKIQKIYNPSPDIKLHLLSSPSESERIKMLVISRLEEHKNLFFLMSLMNTFKKNGQNFSLDIFGDGSQRKNIASSIEYYGLDLFVNLKGYVNYGDINFSKYDVLVLPSLYEGFPNVLLESIANNVPVIAADIMCGPSEIILTRKNGILMTSWDIEDWVKSIIWIKKNLSGRNLELPLALANNFRDHSLKILVDV